MGTGPAGRACELAIYWTSIQPPRLCYGRTSTRRRQVPRRQTPRSKPSDAFHARQFTNPTRRSSNRIAGCNRPHIGSNPADTSRTIRSNEKKALFREEQG
uniref:Uncharacterized protein n=1 Tax=Burkholderia sp. M701 TaxID=326454 RepID=V5YNG4_9BURK|nr:hypothetical protein [Burkholderia sp. M701]